MIKTLSALALVASAPCVAHAQATSPDAPAQREMPARPMPGMPGMAMGRMMMMRGGHGMTMDAASMFLGHTGELQLTDAQVTKLAAIARRSEARQKNMRASMDSTMGRMRMRGEARPGESGGDIAESMMAFKARFDAEQTAQHEDDRETFSIVTPEQLATAWELMRHHQ